MRCFCTGFRDKIANQWKIFDHETVAFNAIQFLRTPKPLFQTYLPGTWLMAETHIKPHARAYTVKDTTNIAGQGADSDGQRMNCYVSPKILDIEDQLRR